MAPYSKRPSSIVQIGVATPTWAKATLAVRRKLGVGTVAVLAAFGAPDFARSAENGAGFYLLGSKGPLAGIVPPAGIYFQNDMYFYGGNIGGGRQLPLGGTISAGVRAKLFAEAPTFLWSTPWQVFGGRLAFSITEPLGGPSVDANIIVGRFLGHAHDSTFTAGDPLVSALIGWDAGNFHWSATSMVNVPVGDYQEGALANLALHRWGADFSAAATWLDPKIGLDISGAMGFTFNGKNPVTQYKTGTEFHFEGAVSQFLSKDFSVGVVGYYYQQISGDSGPGAKLGSFEGRVAALGATASYTFHAGKVPISARLKVFREFAAKNRSEGTAGYLTLSMPIAIAGM